MTILKAETLEIARYITDHPDAQAILQYLRREKSATIYQLGELAVRKRIEEFQADLDKLVEFGVIELAKGLKLPTPVYLITGYGYNVSRQLRKL